MSGTATRDRRRRCCPRTCVAPATSRRCSHRSRFPTKGINFTSVVSQLERELILRCLEKTGGNKRQAARLLQLSRTTLIDKLHRLGGEVDTSDEADAASV